MPLQLRSSSLAKPTVNDKQGNCYCCKMDTKLLKLCDIILCSSLTSSIACMYLPLLADHYFPDIYLTSLSNVPRTVEPSGSHFLCCRDMNDVW